MSVIYDPATGEKKGRLTLDMSEEEMRQDEERLMQLERDGLAESTRHPPQAVMEEMFRSVMTPEAYTEMLAAGRRAKEARRNGGR